MDTKISANRAKKIDIVSELSEKFAKAKAIVFTNYQGLTHKQLEGFKKTIKPLEGEYVVAKNTLLKLALEKSNVKIPQPRQAKRGGQNANLDEALQNPTGTMFLYGDIVEPLKKLAKIIKELNLPTVKFGILGSQALTSEQVLKLATLPSRETLIAQFVGGLKSPLYGLHRALNWNIQKLVLTLKAIENNKSATSN